MKWTKALQLIEPQCATLQSFSSPATIPLCNRSKQFFRLSLVQFEGENKEIIVIVIIINEM